MTATWALATLAASSLSAASLSYAMRDPWLRRYSRRKGALEGPPTAALVQATVQALAAAVPLWAREPMSRPRAPF